MQSEMLGTLTEDSLCIAQAVIAQLPRTFVGTGKRGQETGSGDKLQILSLEGQESGRLAGCAKIVFLSPDPIPLSRPAGRGRFRLFSSPGPPAQEEKQHQPDDVDQADDFENVDDQEQVQPNVHVRRKDGLVESPERQQQERQVYQPPRPWPVRMPGIKQRHPENGQHDQACDNVHNTRILRRPGNRHQIERFDPGIGCADGMPASVNDFPPDPSEKADPVQDWRWAKNCSLLIAHLTPFPFPLTPFPFLDPIS